MLGKRIEDGEFPYWFKSTKKLKRIIKELKARHMENKNILNLELIYISSFYVYL